VLQEESRLADRVLCVTFGAPPSTLTPDESDAYQLSQNPDKSALYWNFLLANSEAAPLASKTEKAKRKVFHKMTLADVLPAVMSTCPASPDSSVMWLEAVGEAQQACKLQGTKCGEFQECVQKVLAAGTYRGCSQQSASCSEPTTCSIFQYGTVHETTIAMSAQAQLCL